LACPARCISIEITEGLLLDEQPAVIAQLARLSAAGIQVSIDDFGTGYSAMAYLKRLDIDTLKIDRSFVRDLTTDPGDLAITEAIIAMAHKLDIKVVGRRYETLAQQERPEPPPAATTARASCSPGPSPRPPSSTFSIARAPASP
jgi:EAL domain-containing protein (putative c-di-GMP-specific phosphodiesterase class I)